MSYRAICADGPCADVQRHISAGRVPQRIWFANLEHLNAETGFTTPFGGWVLVGMADPGPGGPTEPWDEQAEYRLSEELSDVKAGDDPRPGADPLAVYVLVDDDDRQPPAGVEELANA